MAVRVRRTLIGQRGLGVLVLLLTVAGLGMAVWMASPWSWWPAVWAWLGRWWMAPITVLLLAAAVALGVLRSRYSTSPPRPIAEPGTEVMPALTPRAILLGALVLLSLGITAAALLLVNFSGTEPRDRLDAIRTAATLLVGTGGAAALLLAARRQRAAELSLAVQRKVAADTAHDAAARRITELYLKAVEQLGSDKAAVRHGGLYALERVAQDNPDQRQTVINVICAYLRSPYTPPPKPAVRQTGLSAAARRGTAADRVAARAAATRRADLKPPTPAVASEQLRQEREVRLTAQRILTTHLCLDPIGTTGQPTHSQHWAEKYDLDLTGATLIDFLASGITVRRANFTAVHFSGEARFIGATFSGDTLFSGATFDDKAIFAEASFSGYTLFDEAKFVDKALFNKATFDDDANFGNTTFRGDTWFKEVTFSMNAWFAGVIFNKSVWLERTSFKSNAWFDHATFSSSAYFDKAIFTGSALFNGATFTSRASFDEVIFIGDYVTFKMAMFTGDASFQMATFSSIAVMAESKVIVSGLVDCIWPPGWTIEDHRQETAALSEVPDLLRLAPVPVVIGIEPSNGSKDAHSGA